jgi:lysozyme family protein
MTAFDQAFRFLIAHEGGFVNNTSDPGGMTNLGVTKKTWDAHIGRTSAPADMRALTPEAVKPIYRKSYWDAVRGDELPDGVGYAVFDCAVNSGVKRAVKWLQKATGVMEDGQLGPKTLNAVELCIPSTLIDEICDIRLDFMRGLPIWNVFGKGWQRRVEEVRAQAKAMTKTASSLAASLLQ